MYIFNILATAFLVLVGMTVVYWLIEVLATWISPLLTRSSDKKIEREMEKNAQEAIAAIKSKYPIK
ncbi:MAG: hypothetical protein WC551_02590 [Patescibacteria group bacterium]